MGHFKRLFVPAVVACTLLISAASAHAADTDNPEYKSWSGQKVGTVAKWHITTSAAGNKTEIDRSAKLVELTADHAVVEESMAMEVAGQKINQPAQKRTIAAKGAGGGFAGAQPGNANATATDETVDVGGKSYKCKVYTSASDSNGVKATSKVWTCADVPGGLVKMTSSAEGAMKSETTMTLTGIEAAK